MSPRPRRRISPLRIAAVTGVVAAPVALGLIALNAQAAGTFNVSVQTDANAKSLQTVSTFGTSCINLPGAGTYGVLSNYGGAQVQFTTFKAADCPSGMEEKNMTVLLGNQMNVTADLRVTTVKPPTNTRPKAGLPNNAANNNANNGAPVTDG